MVDWEILDVGQVGCCHDGLGDTRLGQVGCCHGGLGDTRLGQVGCCHGGLGNIRCESSRMLPWWIGKY